MLPHLSAQLVATFVLLLSCLSQVISAAGAGLVRGVASFSGNLTQEWPLSGDIVISQRPEPGTSVTVSGSISGLPADQYVLLLVSLGPGYCDDMNRWVRMGDLRRWDHGLCSGDLVPSLQVITLLADHHHHCCCCPALLYPHHHHSSHLLLHQEI